MTDEELDALERWDDERMLYPFAKDLLTQLRAARAEVKRLRAMGLALLEVWRNDVNVLGGTHRHQHEYTRRKAEWEKP